MSELSRLQRYPKHDCSPLIDDYTLSEMVARKDEEGVYYEIPSHILDDCPSIDPDKKYRSFSRLVNKRVEAMRDCMFQSSALPFVPFISFSAKTEDELLAGLQANIAAYPFVKTCRMSPKDLGVGCVFRSAEAAFQAITTSNRTRNWRRDHIVMKAEREFLAEYRCFVYDDKLRAIVLTDNDGTVPSDVDAVVEFMSLWQFDLPHCVCVELGVSRSYKIEIIELNAFGPDLICDPYPFSWKECLIDFYTREEPMVYLKVAGNVGI